MGTSKPVIVYGASGYTGRLVVEFLRHLQIPFAAAGRNGERLRETMKHVPGIETADYEVIEVEHTADALAKAFAGAKVICNTVGPFIHYGETVVQAALRAGCHYIDTNGEQPYILKLRSEYSKEFAAKGLVLAPTAYMHAYVDIAATACAAHDGIDTIESICMPTGTATHGSTQTFIQMVIGKEYYLQGGELVEWPPAYGTDVIMPFTLTPMFVLPWSGSAPPLWYQNHPRIRNFKSLTGFNNRDMMIGVHQVFKLYYEKLIHLSEVDRIKELQAIANSMQPGTPPRENPLIHRCYDVATGIGTCGVVRYAIYSHSPYAATGLLQAFAADLLIRGLHRGVGFITPVQAFGYENLKGVLERFNFARLVKEI
jgi:hypothetical protein